jgi:pantetheine-phosphate adenylyltransferase
MLRVLYPGTFDPPTNGHLNIIYRAARIFDKLEVVIAHNPMKACFFSPEERLNMLSHIIADLDNVELHIWDGIIVKLAEKMGIKVILRGVRALSDFDYEFELSMINKALNSQIETFFLPTDEKYFFLRSSTIMELALFGGDISKMVHPYIEKCIHNKVKENLT